MTLFEFEHHGSRFALPLTHVRRVLPCAAPFPLPDAPEIVLGVLNIGGEVVAVVDLGRRLGLPAAGMRPDQRLLLVEMGGFVVAVLVDATHGVTERRLPPAAVPEKLAGGALVAGIVKLDDGVCVIVDPERFFLEHERIQLEAALSNAGHESR